MPNVIIDDPSFTGQFAEISYCPPGEEGNLIYLGYHQLPFTWITDIYVNGGSFVIYYPSLDLTCGTCPPPPTTTTSSTTTTSTTLPPPVCYCYTINRVEPITETPLYYAYISCTGLNINGELSISNGLNTISICAQAGTVSISNAPGEVLTNSIVCTDQTVCQPIGLCDCITFTNSGPFAQFVYWDLCPGVFGINYYLLPSNSTYKACGSNPGFGDGSPNPNITWSIGEPCDTTNPFPTCVVPKCYTLTSTITPGDSCTVTYYDMYGVFVTLNITTSGTTKICAQEGSIVTNCTTQNSEIIISGGTVICTDDYVCDPTCWCYTVYLTGNSYEFEYTNCAGAIISVILGGKLGNVISFCAQKFTINPIGGDGSIDIYTDFVVCTDEVNCNEITSTTSTTTTAPPCNCWTLVNQQAGTSQFTYVDCVKGTTEGPFDLTGFGTTITQCATSINLVAGAISITNPKGQCIFDNLLGWNCPVDCDFTFDASFPTTTTSTTSTSSTTTTTTSGLTTTTTTVCARPAGLPNSYLMYAFDYLTPGSYRDFQSISVADACDAWVNDFRVNYAGAGTSYAYNIEIANLAIGERVYVIWDATSCQTVPSGYYWYQPTPTPLPLNYFSDPGLTQIAIVTVVNVGGIFNGVSTITAIDYCTVPTTTTTTVP